MGGVATLEPSPAILIHSDRANLGQGGADDLELDYFVRERGFTDEGEAES